MIIHVLKDGRKLNSISGIVITIEQFPTVYKIIEQIEERGETNDPTLRPSEKSS